MNSKGFTLLELLIAVLIFSIGILALAQSQISSIEGNTLARGTTEASSLAQSTIEELKLLQFSSLVDDGLGTLDSEGSDADDYHSVNIYGKSYNVSSNWSDNTPSAGAKTIRVIVSWQDKSVTKRLSLDCIRSDVDI